MTEKRIVAANVEVHTRMAATYNAQEPHFRPENRAKVRRVLESLRARTKGERLLDLGCGTGFIIDLAKDLFREVHGVDVTKAMLDRVDRSSGNVQLHLGLAEQLPFPDATFDMVSAYSFIHHTEDYWKVLREACRVLVPGGICYVDCEPNRLFWRAMSATPAEGLPPRVAKARASVLETDARVEKEFGIPAETFNQAEYSKAILGGVDPREIDERSKELGFSSCAVRFEWFVGQAEVMHGQSFADAETVDAFLRSIAPLSDHLFKYVQVVLVK
jgi:ubiquinone/menaquinone biosynthesis C-methylase UbiE